jgi:hypothetical protein
MLIYENQFMSKKRKKEQKDGTFSPKELYVHDLVKMKEDDFLTFVDKKKNEEWESLPVVKIDTERREHRDRLLKIIKSHFHHPTDFKIKDWMKSEKVVSDTEFVGFPDEVLLSFMNSEFYNEYEKLCISNHRIFRTDNLCDFLNFFKHEHRKSFNFICTQTGKKGDCLLAANVCGFDFIYFCVIVEFQKMDIEKLMQDVSFGNGIILLRYEYNSETVNSDNSDENQDKKRNDDNMQEEEYLELIERTRDVKMTIKHKFFLACPCTKSCIYNTEDISSIIEGVQNDES